MENVDSLDLLGQRESLVCKDYRDCLEIKENVAIKVLKGLKETVARME